MIKRFLVTGIAVMFVGLSLGYVFHSSPPEAVIRTDPSAFVLEDDEILPELELEMTKSVSAEDFAEITGQVPEDVDSWGYDMGTVVRYGEGDGVYFELLVAGFDGIPGARKAFDSVSSTYSREIGRLERLTVGKESYFLEGEGRKNALLFRESNLLVYFEGNVGPEEMEAYADVVEDKIHKKMREMEGS